MENRKSIEQRRYIGCKAKLSEWIMTNIIKEAPDANSFCDIFAGTAIISDRAIKIYNNVIINDFLFSNNIIYKAFFQTGKIDETKLKEIVNYYNNINPYSLEENYFSLNFGNKFFDHLNAKKIGYIREDINIRKNNLSNKEYNILLTSLIYSIDKISNTLGHFDAYIKKEIPYKPFVLQLIDYKCYDNVTIYQEDANQLAERIYADITYIDPPYNSRQYSRFYHVYETLVKWDKPQLFGVAMKPVPENMSKYCSSKAIDAFTDLIEKIKSKYIFVSYNNTYDSKSNSSQNKITLEDITKILSNKGETRIIEHSHPYFNAGKTDFKNHKELLFITKVYGK